MPIKVVQIRRVDKYLPEQCKSMERPRDKIRPNRSVDLPRNRSNSPR